MFLSQEQIADLLESDSEASAIKMAAFMGISNWREDLQMNINLSFLLNAFYSAKEFGLSPGQISAFVGIMKITMEKSMEKGLTHIKSIELFRKVMANHSIIFPGSEEQVPVFGPTEISVLIQHAVSGIFQHYRLFQYVFSMEQEKMDIEVKVTVEKPQSATPLIEAVTLEAYEAEQAKLRQQQLEELETRARLEMERDASVPNPFDVLSSDEIKSVATDVVIDLLKGMRHHFDLVIDEQISKQMASILKLSSGS